MAIPALPFIFKFLLMKLIKGAVVGLVRFIHRVLHKSKTDNDGVELAVGERIKHAVDHEWRKRDNLIYLILMLSNAFYGAQELTVLVWRFAAKRLFNEYCAGIPAGFEMPEPFCDRLHGLSKKALFVECSKWIGMASLVYWPNTHHEMQVIISEDEQWIEIRWKRLVYLVKITGEREIKYRDMTIISNGTDTVEVVTVCGQCKSIMRIKK